MDITWRMKVWDAAGTAKTTIAVDGSIASLTAFDTDGSGNCLEAEFTAVPSEVDIKARDIIQLQVSENDGTDWTSVYKGFIVIAGAPRELDFRNYKAVGLKQRFYEWPLTNGRISGGDVSNMVRRTFGDVGGGVPTVPVPAGVSGYSPDDIPTQNFQLGDRYPQLEHWGEFLDALAESVGSFIVPEGSTYTFDGITYAAGETVPATRWGVDGAGGFFFTRPQAAAVEVGEASSGVMVEWSDVVAEEVFDQVTIVYASEYERDYHWFILNGDVQDAAIAHPLAREYDSGADYDSGIVVPLDAPLDYMEDAAALLGSGLGFNNPSNAFDGDDSTYADAQAGGDTLVAEVADHDACIVRLVFEKAGANHLMDLEIAWMDSGGTKLARIFYPFRDVSSTSKMITILPAPRPAGLSDVDRVRLTLDVSEAGRVYSLEAFVPDEEAAQRLGEAYLRSPQVNASTVQLVGQVGSVSQTMLLAPLDELPVSVPVERVEYALTNEDGLVTTYHLGQAYDPELLSQRAVLESMSRRVARREQR